MKPETYKKWEEALSRFRNAEELLKDEKFDEAEEQASIATNYAFWAMTQLSKELEMPDLSKIAFRHSNKT